MVSHTVGWAFFEMVIRTMCWVVYEVVSYKLQWVFCMCCWHLPGQRSLWVLMYIMCLEICVEYLKMNYNKKKLSLGNHCHQDHGMFLLGCVCVESWQTYWVRRMVCINLVVFHAKRSVALLLSCNCLETYPLPHFELAHTIYPGQR